MKNNLKETIQVLKEDFPNKKDYEIESFAQALFKISKQLDYYNLKMCNVGLEAKEEEKEKIYLDRLKRLCESFGVKYFTQGDARGSAVKLLLPSEKSNSIFERSWGIANEQQ